MTMHKWLCGGALLAVVAAGCSPADYLNPDFLNVLGTRSGALLPGDAPGLIVYVENRTTRDAELVVSYRDADDGIRTYTTFVQAGQRSGQLLVCPIREITLGSVTDLNTVGARVALVDGSVGGVLANVPFIEVEAFGSLLRDEINYECGDAITFVVQPSAQTRTGFVTAAFIRRAAQGE